jgi:hypothetical protein
MEWTKPSVSEHNAEVSRGLLEVIGGYKGYYRLYGRVRQSLMVKPQQYVIDLMA